MQCTCNNLHLVPLDTTYNKRHVHMCYEPTLALYCYLLVLAFTVKNNPVLKPCRLKTIYDKSVMSGANEKASHFVQFIF